MNKRRFEGKHILITGAARGIGFEIARQFCIEGGAVTLLDINCDNLEHAVRQLTADGFTPKSYQVNITDRHAVEKIIGQAERFSPIDVLVNNAGIASESPFLSISLEEWQSIIDVNLTGMFNVSQMVCSHMAKRQKGVVINMGSKNGLDGEAGYAHYNASKGGVLMLTKTMALELAEFNIRVNAVCPGYIQTPMSMEIDSPEFTKKFTDRYIPMNRPGKVEEIAPFFLFLASDECSFMTGQSIVVDGGQLAGQKPGKNIGNQFG